MRDALRLVLSLLAAAPGCGAREPPRPGPEPLLPDYSARMPPEEPMPRCDAYTGLSPEERAIWKELYGGLMGDGDARQRALVDCEAHPRIVPLCHRLLGIRAARAGRGPEAARHDRRYVETGSERCDTEQVRKLLEAYGGAR